MFPGHGFGGTERGFVNFLIRRRRGYLDYIKSQSDLNVLIIDVSDRDFVKNQSDYVFVLDEIRSKAK